MITNIVGQRQLGASGVKVPAMGIGIASWGAKQLGYGKSYTRADIMQAYCACLDRGLNFFDTAEMYENGESEHLLGECRRQDGRPIIISTKVAPHTMMTPSRKRSNPRSLVEALDGSLNRLGVDCIDLYQLHLPPAANKLDEYIDVLAEAVKAGKIRAVGVCNFSTDLMRKAHARLTGHGIPLASTMVGYNLLRRYPETNGVLTACRELDVALIAYAPLAEGVLTGKYRNGAIPVPSSYSMLFRLEQLDLLHERPDSLPLFRRLFMKPHSLQRDKLESLFNVLDEIAKTHAKTIAQVALNWLITSESCVIPIPGAKNARQVSENAAALGWRLSEEERTQINLAEIATH